MSSVMCFVLIVSAAGLAHIRSVEIFAQTREKFIYKCWQCTAVVEVANIAFAEQHLTFVLICETGRNVLLKSTRN